MLRRVAGPSIAIVGGGVIGCAVAFALQRGGASVRVLERDRIGAHASGAAAGMLAPLGESPEQGALAALGARSLALFADEIALLRDESGIDPGFVASGLLRVCDAAEAEGYRERARALAALGARWLERDELLAREPSLSPELVGALWSPREAHVDSLRLTHAYAVAAERSGARFDVGVEVQGLLRAGERVVGVRTSEGNHSADAVVLCGGAWTRSAEAWLDLALPIEPVKGQMLALEASALKIGALIWGAGAYLVPRANGSVRVGATVERVGFDARPTARGVAELLAGAVRLVPRLAEARFDSTWASLRPVTPDELPLVGPVASAPGLVLAAGHGRNGILLCPLTARLVADGLLRGVRDPDAAALAPERFALPSRD
jgi:glycine oxidase